MENYLYGRYTTLERLRAVRDDPLKHPFHRLQADRNIQKIQAQLKDRHLMRLRERLIQATRALDHYEAWKIENQIRAYEGSYDDRHDREA